MKHLLLLVFAVFLADSVPMEKAREEKRDVEPEYLDTLLKEHRYEEFSDLMGLGNPRLAMPRNASDETDPSYVDPSFHRGLFEGDIILSPVQEERGRQGINLARYSGNRWPGSPVIVPYAVSTSLSSTTRTLIERCITTWNTDLSSCVQFKRRTSEPDYCFFFPGDGCYANLGRVRKQQPISIGSGCESAGTVLHEMTHSCGMIHEQSRPGRNSNVTVLYENIPSEWHDQYHEESSSDFNILGPYECGSCMHYPMNAPGTNKPAFRWVGNSCPDTSQVGQRWGMTELDKTKVRNLFGC